MGYMVIYTVTYVLRPILANFWLKMVWTIEIVEADVSKSEKGLFGIVFVLILFAGSIGLYNHFIAENLTPEQQAVAKFQSDLAHSQMQNLREEIQKTRPGDLVIMGDEISLVTSATGYDLVAQFPGLPTARVGLDAIMSSGKIPNVKIVHFDDWSYETTLRQYVDQIRPKKTG